MRYSCLVVMFYFLCSLQFAVVVVVLFDFDCFFFGGYELSSSNKNTERKIYQSRLHMHICQWPESSFGDKANWIYESTLYIYELWKFDF